VTSRRAWRLAWLRLRSDWPAKMAAVVAALVLWWVASNTTGLTAQRSLLVDLEVVGMDVDEVAVGVPLRVEVVVTGPSERMSRLSADDVDATLDVTDVDGAFERAIEARVPQTLRVVGVVPAEVIGRIEAVRGAEFAVEATLRGQPVGLQVNVRSVEPSIAVVEARDPILAEVASVMAVVDGSTLNEEGEAGAGVERVAPLVAVDADGRPVAEVRVVPSESRVTFDVETVRAARTLDVRLASPPNGVVVGRLEPTRVTLLGPPADLDAIDVVTASVPEETRLLPPGEYAVSLDVAVPPGIAVLEPVNATVTVNGATDTP